MEEKKEKLCPLFKTSIGGQALIEGIMMKGPDVTAMAVRRPDKEIEIEKWETPKRTGVKKIPIVRGIFIFIDTMIGGYKCLMRSAEISGEEEEPTKFDLWLEKKFGKKAEKAVALVATFVALIITLLMFIIAPAALVKFLTPFIPNAFLLTAIEGVLKMVIFLLYIIFASKEKNVARVFMYHGGEHKTISCYEAGEELTVENARKYTRFHPRCGTSFVLIVLIISILVNTLISWESVVFRVGMKLLFLPLVVGIAWEIIKIAGKYDNPFTRFISAPGLWLQRFTTREPDDSMLECAIAAMKEVIPKDREDKW